MLGGDRNYTTKHKHFVRSGASAISSIMELLKNLCALQLSNVMQIRHHNEMPGVDHYKLCCWSWLINNRNNRHIIQVGISFHCTTMPLDVFIVSDFVPTTNIIVEKVVLKEAQYILAVSKNLIKIRAWNSLNFHCVSYLTLVDLLHIRRWYDYIASSTYQEIKRIFLKFKRYIIVVLLRERDLKIATRYIQ